jgi:hypothetical protein
MRETDLVTIVSSLKSSTRTEGVKNQDTDSIGTDIEETKMLSHLNQDLVQQI